MKHHRLNEDKLPPKIPVRFSIKVSSKIDSIISHNKGNIQAISEWLEYLETVKNYVSNPVIAWDYTNRNIQLKNGTKFIQDFDFNIGYTIITDYTTNSPFVYIFMVNLKPQEFGLRECKRRRNAVTITESKLRRIIAESIRKILYN